MRTSIPSRQRWRLVGAAGAALLLALVGASPAMADPPVQTTMPFSLVVQDAGAECGFPVRWEISGELRETQFFDDEGRLVRIVSHIRETNRLTNLATGKTITDEPKFNQIVHFNPDGTISSVETMGLYVNARGDRGANVMDVGKVIIARPTPTERVLVFSAGQHPFRAETLLSLQAGLSAFCEVLT
jgi:hypothetical protein